LLFFTLEGEKSVGCNWMCQLHPTTKILKAIQLQIKNKNNGMAKNKTVETENSVAEFLAVISDVKRREDSTFVIDLLSKLSGFEPKMWGSSIVGFGIYHYKYESGHSGNAPLAGLASRKNALTVYLASNFEEKEALLSQLGKHKSSKSCLYIQKIEDIDIDILSQLVQKSIEQIRELYPD
jgi:hypothetical protein